MEFSTELLDQITDLLLVELETQLSKEKEAKMADFEGAMREILQYAGAQALGKYLTAREKAYPEPDRPCACGELAVYHSRRAAKTLTVFGWVTYRRAYYTCSACHQGQAPLDLELGLEPGKVSAGLAPLLALAGVNTSFGQSSQEILWYLLLRVSENTIRKETQQFGQLQKAREAEWIADSRDAESFQERKRKSKEPPQRLYGTLDGAHAPLQAEWREMKVGAWFEVETIAPEQVRAYRRAKAGDTEALRAKNISYYCDIQTAHEFGSLLWATGCQRQADLAQELVFVADGAAWIWKLVDFYFPDAVQIVDWYHAEEYLEKIGMTAWGDDQTARQDWLEEVRTDLWEGRVKRVIAACRQMESDPKAHEEARKAVSYFTNNQARMDYAHFRARGYMIGSGTVESGCKQIVSYRLKRAGARWTEEGACLTAKARAAFLSDQWDQLAERRSELPLAV
jgi:hypothetical protein